MDSMSGVYLGDCLDLMDNIPDGSVDMVLTDLPYGITACKWDKSILDFEALWKQWNRVCKKDAPVVLFASGVFVAQCVMSNPANYKYKWVWEKVISTNAMNAKKMPMRKHEDILVFYRKLPTYNPQMGVGDPYKKHRPSPNRPAEVYGGEGWERAGREANEGDRYPYDILRFSNARDELDVQGGKQYHPTQKPIELLRYLIKTYTNEGDTVLDSTCGSGSTCVAAALEGREYIGIELDEGYHATAVERVGNLGAYEPTPRLEGV